MLTNLLSKVKNVTFFAKKHNNTPHLPACLRGCLQYILLGFYQQKILLSGLVYVQLIKRTNTLFKPVL